MVLQTLAIAQVVDQERYFEMLSDSGADEQVVESAMEQLNNGSFAGVNLNTADENQLQQMLMLDFEQALALISYRELWPPLLSVNELFLIDGWDSSTVLRVAPFVITPWVVPDDSLSKDDLLRFADHDLLLRFSGSTAKDTANPYDGSRQKVLFKYSYNADDRVFAGFVAEKDPGEPVRFDSVHKGFDYYAGYVLYKGQKCIDQFIAGDYNLQFGQGLTFWSGFALSSGVEMTSGRRIAMDIRRHSGTEENDFLRGAAMTIKHKRLKATVFGSAHQRDANFLVYDSIADEAMYSGFKSGGYHRNTAEIEEKNNLMEYLAGGNVSLSLPSMRIGITSCYQKIKGRFEEKSGTTDWYKYSGSDNLCAGIDFVATIRKMLFYGEGSMSINGSKAFVVGGDIIPDTRLHYSFNVRYADADFQNLHSSIFRLSSGSNQTGLYQSVYLYLNRSISCSGYLDFSRRRAMKTGCHKPISETIGAARVNGTFGRDLKVYFQIAYKSSDDDAGAENSVSWRFYRQESLGSRLHVEHNISRCCRIQQRMAWSKVIAENHATGFLYYLDFRLHNLRYPVTLSMRYTYFETDDFSSRIYSYESNVLYSFSVPAYYGKGSSCYLYFAWKPIRKLTLYGRVSTTLNQQAYVDDIQEKRFRPAYSLQFRLSL